MSGKPKLLLVDDHHLVLEGLRLELQEEFDIVGTVAQGTAVAAECRRLGPDLLLLDLSLPDRSGLEVIDEVLVEKPTMRILVVTMHRDRVLADAVLQAGASGFIPKDAAVDELRWAIRAVLAGSRYVSPLVTEGADPYPDGLSFDLGRLTQRQQQVVRLLGDGKSTARIAEELQVSPNTVTFHRVRIRKALGIGTEWGLMRYALVVRMSESRGMGPEPVRRSP
jgi:DNA-binding NarL/FixJ family response regulator